MNSELCNCKAWNFRCCLDIFESQRAPKTSPAFLCSQQTYPHTKRKVPYPDNSLLSCTPPTPQPSGFTSLPAQGVAQKKQPRLPVGTNGHLTLTTRPASHRPWVFTLLLSTNLLGALQCPLFPGSESVMIKLLLVSWIQCWMLWVRPPRTILWWGISPSQTRWTGSDQKRHSADFVVW